MENNALLKEENVLREALAELNQRMRRDKVLEHSLGAGYSQAYSRWFNLREAGLARGIFRFFVPSGNDKGGE